MAVVDARDRVGRAGKVGRPLRGRRLGPGGGGLAAKKRKKRKIGDAEVGFCHRDHGARTQRRKEGERGIGKVGWPLRGRRLGGRPLDTLSYADIMSDMKTFTVRELDRSPGVVLEASRIDGKARIRARGGQAYIIMPESAPAQRITSLPNFAARRAALLAKPLSPEFTRKFDRALAGE